jgi:hypothetical protein
VLAFNPRNSYMKSMTEEIKVKITERIAFHAGVLYGFLKGFIQAKIILWRKEIICAKKEEKEKRE